MNGRLFRIAQLKRMITRLHGRKRAGQRRFRLRDLLLDHSVRRFAWEVNLRCDMASP